MIVNLASIGEDYPSASATICAMYIKPFYRCLLGDGTSSTNYSFYSSDPATVLSHAQYTWNTSSANTHQVLQNIKSAYWQVLSYYEMFALYSDGTLQDLKYIANSGTAITANCYVAYSGSNTIYNGEFFNNQGFANTQGSGVLTCPANISTRNIIGYNNGSNADVEGCFIYVSSKYNGNATGGTSVGVRASTFAGVSLPVIWSHDWGDR